MMKRILASVSTVPLLGRDCGRLLLILFALAVVMTASAQGAFLDGLRKIEDGKGKIIVMQSPEIDRLVNGTSPDLSINAGTKTAGSKTSAGSGSTAGNAGSKTTATPHHDNTKQDDHKSSQLAGTGHTSVEDSVPTVVDTRKKVMRNSYKTTGYRIQVFSGGNKGADKQKAEAAGRAMKTHFPYEPIYVHFYSPSWKCRMGNYKELSDAQQILSQVKALGYKNACIVKGTITVPME